MSLVLVLLAMALLAMPGLLRVRFGRLAGADATRLGGLALGAGAASLWIGIALLAVPGVLDQVASTHLAAACHHVVAWTLPAHPAVALVALVVSAGLAARAGQVVRRARWRRRALRVEPWLGTHDDRGPYVLVVMPGSDRLAMSVPGAPGQVVIGDGLLARLGPDRASAVIAHEVAHLTHGHDRFLLLARVVERALGPVPGVHASVAVLRTSVERWADEIAVRSAPAQRRSLREAILSLAAGTGASDLPAGTVDGDRLDSLDRRRGGPPARSAPVLGAVATLCLGAVTAAVIWSLQSHHALVLGAACAG